MELADRGSLEVVHADFGDPQAMRATAEGVEAFFLLTPPSEQQVRWLGTRSRRPPQRAWAG